MPDLSDFDWWLDELEPCDECDLGLCYLLNYEGRRLCRNCLDRDIEEKGFDELPESWEPATQATQAKEESLTFVKQKRKYTRRSDREEESEEKDPDVLF